MGEQPVGMETGLELGRNVYSRYIDVFAQGSADLMVDVAGQVRLADGGWYELTLVRQPTLWSDRVSIRLEVPEGFEVLDADGLKVVSGRAEGNMDLTRTRTVRIKIGHSDDRGLWERLQDGP